MYCSCRLLASRFSADTTSVSPLMQTLGMYIATALHKTVPQAVIERVKGRRRALLLSVWVIALAGCTIPPQHPTLKKGALPPLLPVRAFVASTDFVGGFQISPDGTRLAWIAVHGIAPRIFVKTIGRDDTRSLGLFSLQFRWAQDSRRLLVHQGSGATEAFHIVAVDVENPGKAPVVLTAKGKGVADIHQVIQSDPVRILVIHNHRDAQVFDLYRIDLDTGESARIAQNPGDVASWVTDRDGVLRGRVRYAGERRWLEMTPPGREDWSETFAWEIHDAVSILGFTAENDALWLLSNRGRDRVALTRFDLRTRTETVVYDHERVDVTNAHLSRASHTPAIAYAHPDYPVTHVFDAAQRADLNAALKKLGVLGAQPIGVEILSADDKDQVGVLSLYSHEGKRYYLWNRATGRITFVAADAMNRHAPHLAPIRPIALKSRDGLTLHGYLTLPRGVPAENLPTIVLVHGGPWVRNQWADPDWLPDYRQVQFLANRGYAVLQVNYRGSTGYGRAFMQAAAGEFAGKMQDDLTDAAQWAVEQKIADPEKIAIVGASYGGYAALVGLTFTPTRFTCAVAQVAPADLVALMENLPEYWKHEMPFWLKYVGNPRVPEERAGMMARSPLHRAAAAQRPVLIIQGSEDVRVKAEQGDRMVAALRAARKAVEYVVISGMGHVAYHWPDAMKIYRTHEDFLARCLGGRSSGFDFYQLGAWAFPR